MGPFDKSSADRFVKRLGYVRHTIFGGMWDLTPDLTEHADTAYTSIFLGPHTDGTYSHDAPGLQFFLCLKAADSGGESLLVDGLAIAAELAESEPDLFVDLASIPVPGRYVEPGVSLRAERPVFRTNARGLLDQVSFNNYDRAPFLLPPDLEQRFYRAYGRFAELANEPNRRAAITLTPGDIMIFDNWRSLHGRNAFTGYRHYFGAYLNHEDLESKRRVLDLAT
jgi:alpha-ketoglutarate-dependent taurine dioxygenase